MSDDAQTSYDEIPYDSHPFERSHPDHLASIAKLFGLESPNVDNARVLELGCAAGGNLIPQAVSLPDAQFVGIDLSRIQIEQGQADLAKLGLQNIQLQHRSIMDVNATDGKFDYIICHGVYSWVSQETREKILQICRDNLSENGVAYISYNTNPGWFMRGMVRQMMCFHAKQFSDPKTQVQQARALLDFLINAGPAGDPAYHALLVRELEILRGRADSYLFHEHLEEDNEPVFFYEFNEAAEAKGLRYLGEVQFSEMVPSNFSQTADATLRELGVGLAHSEQYLDFLRNRTFRRTLLCHHEVEPKRQLDGNSLKGTFVSSQLKAPERVNLAEDSEVSFLATSGATVSVTRPLAKAALLKLSELWPGGSPFERLSALAHEALGHSPVRSKESIQAENEEVGQLILELYASDLVELRVSPPRYKSNVEERPKTTGLARLECERGDYVTTQRHSMIALTDLQKRLVLLADGERDHAAICDELAKSVEAGDLVIEIHSADEDDDRAKVREVLLDLIQHDLAKLMEAGLLV